MQNGTILTFFWWIIHTKTRIMSLTGKCMRNALFLFVCFACNASLFDFVYQSHGRLIFFSWFGDRNTGQMDHSLLVPKCRTNAKRTEPGVFLRGLDPEVCVFSFPENRLCRNRKTARRWFPWRAEIDVMFVVLLCECFEVENHPFNDDQYQGPMTLWTRWPLTSVLPHSSTTDLVCRIICRPPSTCQMKRLTEALQN